MYLNFKEGGKGFAIIQGIKNALNRKNDLIGFVDADNSTSPEAFYDLVKNIDESVDVAEKHPKIVKRLEAEAEKARVELGDQLTKRSGKGVREPGRLEQSVEPR